MNHSLSQPGVALLIVMRCGDMRHRPQSLYDEQTVPVLVRSSCSRCRYCMHPLQACLLLPGDCEAPLHC